jgi:hypothetical protein
MYVNAISGTWIIVDNMEFIHTKRVLANSLKAYAAYKHIMARNGVILRAFQALFKGLKINMITL